MRKRKKISCLLGMLLMTLFVLLWGAQVQAEEAGTAEGDWEYSLDQESRTAAVTAYHGSGQAVTIPEMLGGCPVTAIGSEAFRGNTSMSAVTMPDTVTVIGNKAFADCNALTDVFFSQGLTEIGVSAFEGSKVKSVTIPDSVTYIGPYAFRNCTGLRSLDLGSGIQEWGEDWGTNGAFSGCSLLSSLTIPNGVSSIGTSAFSGCTLLMEVVLPESCLLYTSPSPRD